MDLSALKEILQLLADKEIAEFELEEEGMRLRIRKGAVVVASAAAPAGSVTAPAPTAPQAVAAAASAALASATAQTVAAEAAKAAAAEAGLTVLKSPIIGTFYRAPDPNSPPYVNVGDRVRVGQVLCIVEAMKLMNEIEAESAGEIVHIHQENGQPVQFGDPLFSIRPA